MTIVWVVSVASWWPAPPHRRPAATPTHSATRTTRSSKLYVKPPICLTHPLLQLLKKIRFQIAQVKFGTYKINYLVKLEHKLPSSVHSVSDYCSDKYKTEACISGLYYLQSILSSPCTRSPFHVSILTVCPSGSSTTALIGVLPKINWNVLYMRTWQTETKAISVNDKV
jgi:hypothetical protein